MKFDVLVDNQGFTIGLHNIANSKRLKIKYFEFEDPMLLSRDSIEIEIRKRVREEFGYKDIELIIGEEAQKGIWSILRNNKIVFESE